MTILVNFNNWITIRHIGKISQTFIVLMYMSTRKQRIEQALTPIGEVDYLDVIDESHRHHVPEGAESHFKVTIVAARFDSMRLIERHRLINELLQTEFDTGLHALSIHAYTPKQWQQKGQSPRSPACRDGYGN